MTTTRKINLLILVFLFFALYIIVGSYYARRIGIANFNKFYNANLDGDLSSIASHKGITIRVGNINENYVFYPHTDDQLNEGKYFPLFAKPGDYVSKHSRSDTLYLKKNGKIYKYTFDLYEKESR